jgi:hypothetical protein
MDFIVLTLFILVIIILLSLFFSWFFIDISTNNSIRETYDEKYNRIINKLTKALILLCKQLEIPIYYEEDLGKSAGQFHFKVKQIEPNISRFIRHDCIKILNSEKEKPYVLAHEVGHFYDISKKQILIDNFNREDDADKQAFILCKSFLTQDEFNFIRIYLLIHFDFKTYLQEKEEKRKEQLK